MKFYDMVGLAGRNLREAGLRNSLTTLGISVGVASLVAMLSLGIGLQLLFRRELGRSSLFDSVFVTTRQDFRQRRVADNRPSKPLDDSARRSFEQISGVSEVYPSFGAVGEFRLEDSKPGDSHFSVLTGLPSSARNGEAFDEVQGQFWHELPKLSHTEGSSPLRLVQRLIDCRAQKIMAHMQSAGDYRRRRQQHCTKRVHREGCDCKGKKMRQQELTDLVRRSARHLGDRDGSRRHNSGDRTRQDDHP